MRPCGKVILCSPVLLCALLIGCDTTPEAPELVDSPVYQNDSEGFRFRVPEGWTQTASSELPAGDFEGENYLVRYLVQSPAGGATLQVLCFIDEPQTDLQSHHAGPSFGVESWEVAAPLTTATIGGVEVQRISFEGILRGKPMHKDVLCVRRDNRVYSFVGMYTDGDEKAQQAIQRALTSLTWDS